MNNEYLLENIELDLNLFYNEILDEFKNEELAENIIKIFLTVLKKLLEIILAILNFFIKNFYVTAAKFCDKLLMQYNDIKGGNLTGINLQMFSTDVNEIIKVENINNDIIRQIQDDFKSIDRFITIEEIYQYNKNNLVTLNSLKDEFTQKYQILNNQIEIVVDKDRYLYNFKLIKNIRKELYDCRMGLVDNKNLIKRKIKEIESHPYSETNEFLKAKISLMENILTNLTTSNKERVNILKLKLDTIKDQNYSFVNFYNKNK